MSVSLPNGSIISMAASYGTAVPLTAISNANPALVTSVAHGLADGDILEIRSGWSQLDQRILRVDDSVADAFDLESFNSSDTAKYPAGGGVGTAREVTAWTQITQILESTSQGGEQQFASYGFLEDSKERQLPTVKSAESIVLLIGDDQTLPWYDLMVAADEDRLPRAIRVRLPSGAIIFYNAYVTINKTPSLTRNEIMRLQATLSFVADTTRYAS
jgi:hypothetical protein